MKRETVTKQVTRRQAAEFLTDVAYMLLSGEPLKLDGGHRVPSPTDDDVLVRREGGTDPARVHLVLELTWPAPGIDR